MTAHTPRLGLSAVFLVVILLSACNQVPQSLPESRDVTDMPASLITAASPTPTYVGTWETIIDGLVYDGSSGSDRPIAGAVVQYDVQHTYFPELQMGRDHTALTDEQGIFALPVAVHDTDRIIITVEAQGYLSHEVSLVGIDLVAGAEYDIGLIPQSDK